MSHSSSDDNFQEEPKFRAAVLDKYQKEIEGTYPDGKLSDIDEGAIALSVGLLDNKVVVNFAKPIQSLGMAPDQAIQLAQDLLKRAGYSKGIKITVTIDQQVNGT